LDSPAFSGHSSPTTQNTGAAEMPQRIRIDRSELAEFCGQNHISKLSFFGSILGNDFRPDSDVDVLVEFESGQEPGLLGLGKLERELSFLLGNRRVDLRTSKDLSRYFRDDIIATAELQYAQA
jgi:predicted nucleotidyltransferase